MSFDLTTSEGRAASLRQAAENRFGCPHKAKSFLEGQQRAYLGEGQTPLSTAERSEQGHTTALAMLSYDRAA